MIFCAELSRRSSMTVMPFAIMVQVRSNWRIDIGSAESSRM